MIPHNYQSIEGWFNMEKQYLELLSSVPEGGIFVELGAYKGKSTSFIMTEISNQGRNIEFYTVDTFLGDSGSLDQKEVEAYTKVNTSKMIEEFRENTKHLSHLSNFSVLQGYSYDLADDFADNSVSALFIDAGHSYESVLKDINAWLPKIASGGIIAGHDYNNVWPGVIKAVNEVFGKPDKVENDCWFVYK